MLRVVTIRNAETITIADNMENLRLGAYIPEERIKDMDAIGTDLSGESDVLVG